MKTCRASKTRKERAANWRGTRRSPRREVSGGCRSGGGSQLNAVVAEVLPRRRERKPLCPSRCDRSTTEKEGENDAVSKVLQRRRVAVTAAQAGATGAASADRGIGPATKGYERVNAEKVTKASSTNNEGSCCRTRPQPKHGITFHIPTHLWRQ